MGVIKFTETAFSSKNKKGILKPDENGYYEVILGALNVYNSANEYYVADRALELFKNSSHLMRRIETGVLYSEVGHPKKMPGMSNEDYYRRIITLEETNLCGHIFEIRLDYSYGKNNPELNNPEMIAIIGKVKPSGNKANALELSLTNPKENTSFSIRGLTDNVYKNGRVERTLTDIITWDFVTEPGINIAKKSYSPSLESININEIMDLTINKEVLTSIEKEVLTEFANEDSKALYNNILKTLNKPSTVNKLTTW